MTHGDGGSGKKKHRHSCDPFHDFAVGEHNLGILLGDHVKALSQQKFVSYLYSIAFPIKNTKARGTISYYSIWGWGGVGRREKRERIRIPVPN